MYILRVFGIVWCLCACAVRTCAGAFLDDCAADTAVREVKEETGIDASMFFFSFNPCWWLVGTVLFLLMSYRDHVTCVDELPGAFYSCTWSVSTCIVYYERFLGCLIQYTPLCCSSISRVQVYISVSSATPPAQYI